MPIEAILFDLDGVLIDSRNANRVFYREILLSLGYACPANEDCDAVFHLSMRDALRLLSGEEAPLKLQRIWNEGTVHSFPVHLMKIPEGAQAAIDLLSERYLLGIVTNGVYEGVKDFFRLFGRKSKFGVVIAFENVSHHKPDPEPLTKALAILGVTSGRAIYVGDSFSDVLAARNAGVRVCTFGAEIGGDLNVATFKSLVTVIDNISN